MPRFSDCCENSDMFICQICAVDQCSGCKYGDRIDLTNITGFKGKGNACKDCIASMASDQKLSAKNANPGLRLCRPFQNRKAGAHYWDVNTGQDAETPANLEFNPEGICPRHRLQSRQARGSQSTYRRPPKIETDYGRHHRGSVNQSGGGREDNGPISLHEHCRRESGLTGRALEDYINRYYGHG